VEYLRIDGGVLDELAQVIAIKILELKQIREEQKSERGKYQDRA
jgi:hypothetical protein